MAAGGYNLPNLSTYLSYLFSSFNAACIYTCLEMITWGWEHQGYSLEEKKKKGWPHAIVCAVKPIVHMSGWPQLETQQISTSPGDL